ncbi:amino acid ABC transporter permease [Shimazuella alba]|jgi:cystine transport system permease protein|uniref:ABC transporter permease subunit n=1 Tax=Shimazuella alba TaxID=2690964 RepID=A0A6I4VWT5_9BACL|nr:amino acid ABC transporter permease [Shimazuella alba]MXQ55091.1 ABC transporter permease subunit [Shimazuella alba]
MNWNAIQWNNLFDFQLAQDSAWFVLQGLKYTILITIITMVIGLLLGLIVALMRMSSSKILRYPARAYISIIRGTPLLVQLFILYFGLPVIGLNLTPFLAAVIGLSLNVGGYSAETFRGALLAIPKGQWEAAYSINMSYSKALRRIVMPQALRVALPSLANTLLSLVKDTSLLSMITVPEMLYQAKIIGGREFDYLTMYILVAIFYWIVCTILAWVQDRLEDRYGKFTK